jgi:hypothetical protein
MEILATFKKEIDNTAITHETFIHTRDIKTVFEES